MWLINTSSLELVEFITVDIAPPYVILSHTWGEEEMNFQDWCSWPHSTATRRKKGYEKTRDFLAKAASHKYKYAWIDTCCIDKKSSAELSEAINSMYRWYRKAQECYVYLSDVYLPAGNKMNDKEFLSCRWFTRGWTLQELLAPAIVSFFDRQWRYLGSKYSMRDLICDASGMRTHHLIDHQEACVAAKMSWASRRNTTRKEDAAYCLLGLFDVNMPLLYGEGNKAFRRLQQEILKSSGDESIFAWKNKTEESKVSGILAKSPADFWDSGDLDLCRPPRNGPSPATMTNYCLSMQLGFKEVVSTSIREKVVVVPFGCQKSDRSDEYFEIVLVKTLPAGAGCWKRKYPFKHQFHAKSAYSTQLGVHNVYAKDFKFALFHIDV